MSRYLDYDIGVNLSDCSENDTDFFIYIHEGGAMIFINSRNNSILICYFSLKMSWSLLNNLKVRTILWIHKGSVKVRTILPIPEISPYWLVALTKKCPDSKKNMSGILDPRIPTFRNSVVDWSTDHGLIHRLWIDSQIADWF